VFAASPLAFEVSRSSLLAASPLAFEALAPLAPR
jgi:hypothetical protein